jgi:Zn-dependent protease with chaperone function
VALLLDGQEVLGTTTDLRERRLLNVVEEMAIAAGVPMPPVYLLPEKGINAFAAGHAPGDVVVAVSQGCLPYLTRDELQGVVGHEFSHILNADVRLNLRIVMLIFGILAISQIGFILMRTDPAQPVLREDKTGGPCFVPSVSSPRP